MRTNVDFRNVSCLVTHRDSSNKQRVAFRKARARSRSGKLKKNEKEIEGARFCPTEVILANAFPSLFFFFFKYISAFCSPFPKDTDPRSRCIVCHFAPASDTKRHTRTINPRDKNTAAESARVLTKVNKTRLLIAIAAPQ